MKDRAKASEARARENEGDKSLPSFDNNKQKQTQPPSTSDVVKAFVFSHIPEEYKEVLTVENLITNKVRDFAEAKDTSVAANPVIEAIRDAASNAISPAEGTAVDVAVADMDSPAVQKQVSPMQKRRGERKQQAQQESTAGSSTHKTS